jgi:hypothetical protein
MEGSPGYGMEDMDDNMMGDPMDMEYGQEQDGMEYGDEQNEYGAENEDEEEIDFSADPQFQGMPPLDKMRKVRREIIKTINEIREKFSNPHLQPDIQAHKAANDYAEFLLQHEDQEDEAVKKEIFEKHFVIGEHKVLQGIAYLEEDIVSDNPTKKDEFMDAHGLLLELQYELGQLTSKDYTHVGIGFAANTQKVKVVELLSTQQLINTHLGQTEDGAVEVRGQVIKPKEVGLYAASICPGTNVNKQISIIGPAGIEYDKETGAYTVTLKTQGMENLFFSQDEPKFLELWVQTKQVEKIKYGAEAQPDERVNTKHLHLSARLPMDYYPDPRVVIED